MALTESVAELRADIDSREHPMLTASCGDDIDIALVRYAYMSGGVRVFSPPRRNRVSAVSVIICVSFIEFRVSSRGWVEPR